MSTYATDGRCHNAEPGTFGHECGKPATWLGSRAGKIPAAKPFVMGFCDACKQRGHDAKDMQLWQPCPQRFRDIAAWRDEMHRRIHREAATSDLLAALAQRLRAIADAASSAPDDPAARRILDAGRPEIIGALNDAAMAQQQEKRP